MYVYFTSCMLVLLIIATLNAESNAGSQDSFDMNGTQSFDISVLRFYSGDSITGPATTSTTDTESYVDPLTVHFTAFGQNFIIDLRLNRRLDGSRFVAKVSADNEGVFRATQQSGIDCYYYGTVRNSSHSTAAFSTCQGFKGHFVTGIESYYIKPLLHDTVAVYRDSDDRRTPKKCGVTNPASRDSLPPSNVLTRLWWAQARRSIPTAKMRNNDEKVVELYLVNDVSQFKKMSQSVEDTLSRSLTIANIVNSLYQSVGITVVLVGVEVWTDVNKISITQNSTETLMNFLEYRQKSINKRQSNDNAHLITSIEFSEDIVGKAVVGGMCSSRYSGGVNSDVNSNAKYVATSMAHELGHSFGLNHDDASCDCGGNNEDGTSSCIMWPTVGGTNTMSRWSQCSLRQFKRSFSEGRASCLHNYPSIIFSTASPCGNGRVDSGEECDCGISSNSVCNTTCCDEETCQLISPATCASGRCCDTATCQTLSSTVECRSAAADELCDLPEFCDGQHFSCPDDVHVSDGSVCSTINDSHVSAYCYEGRCQSHAAQCQLLWGAQSKPSDEKCFTQLNILGDSSGNCGVNLINQSYIACTTSDVMCGVLHCSSTTRLAIYPPEYTFSDVLSRIGSSVCNSINFDFGVGYHDPGLVPNGASCGEDKMCVRHLCVDVTSLQTDAKTCDPTSDCNGNGVCNTLGQCHCDDKFRPPDCVKPGCGGSLHSSKCQARNVTRIVALLATPGVKRLTSTQRSSVSDSTPVYAQFTRRVTHKQFGIGLAPHNVDTSVVKIAVPSIAVTYLMFASMN